MGASEPSILLFGGTGLVGTHLLPALREHAPSSPLTVFLRTNAIDNYLTKTLSVSRVVHGSFSDYDIILQLASEHDIIINVGSSWDTALSEAIVKGMTEGYNTRGGKKPALIHMSGAGNFVDKRWVDGSHHSESKVTSDDNISDMKVINPSMLNGGPDTVVLSQAAKSNKINTYIVFPSGVFGSALPQPGLEHKTPPLGVIQLLMHMKTEELGFTPYVGEGSAIFNALHISAIAPFMLKLLDLAVKERREDVKWDTELSGYERCYIIGGPEVTWKETSDAFARVLKKVGVTEEGKAKSVADKKATGEGEIGMLMCSDVRIVSPRAERLGYTNDGVSLVEWLEQEDAARIFPLPN